MILQVVISTIIPVYTSCHSSHYSCVYKLSFQPLFMCIQVVIPAIIPVYTSCHSSHYSCVYELSFQPFKIIFWFLGSSILPYSFSLYLFTSILTWINKSLCCYWHCCKCTYCWVLTAYMNSIYWFLFELKQCIILVI